MSETHYTPGVCNLNLPEIAYRRKVSNVSLGIAVVLLIILIATKATAATGILLFLPTWIGYLNHLQAKNKFCVMYASSGVYSKSDNYAETAEVTDEAKHQKDKAKAGSMNIQGFVAGILGAFLSVVILAAL